MVTVILIIINTIVGIISFSNPTIIREYGHIPYLVLSGEWFRIVTSLFVHSGIVHLASNMTALLYCGPKVEKELGSLKFAILYLLSGIGGSILVLLLSSSNDCTVGASGSIFGIMGALFVLSKMFNDKKQLAVIGQNIAINLYYTFTDSSISIGGHIGGLITGIIVCLILMNVNNKKYGSKILEFLIIAISLALLFTGKTPLLNKTLNINNQVITNLEKTLNSSSQNKTTLVIPTKELSGSVVNDSGNNYIKTKSL